MTDPAHCALPALTPLTKRIVLKHPSGLWQILGASVEQPEAFLALHRADVDGQDLPINLIAARPRYYLFTVVQKPAGLGTFHEDQR